MKKILALTTALGIVLAAATPASAWSNYVYSRYGGWGGYGGGWGYGGAGIGLGLALGALAGTALAAGPYNYGPYYGGYGYGGGWRAGGCAPRPVYNMYGVTVGYTC